MKAGSGLDVVLAQRGDFARREVTPRSRSQPGQPNRPNAHAGELGHRVPNCGEHAAHLPVAPFKDGQFYLRAAVVVRFFLCARIRTRRAGTGTRRAGRDAGAHRPDGDVFRAARKAVFQHQARAQTPQGICVRHAAHFRPVRLGNVVLGVRHLIQEVAVIGEKDQALAFLV